MNTMTKYFQKIPKEWKAQGAVLSCERCGKPIDEKTDHFTLAAHWKIKDTPDTFTFCSLACLEHWAAEDSLVQA